MSRRAATRVEDKHLELDDREWKARRERLGLSVEELAERLGIEPHILSGVEKGYRKLTAAQAGAIIRRSSVLERAASRMAINRALSSPTAAAIGEVA